jgi:hypothetical protein
MAKLEVLPDRPRAVLPAPVSRPLVATSESTAGSALGTRGGPYLARAVDLLALQRAAGNRATTAHLQRRRDGAADDGPVLRPGPEEVARWTNARPVRPVRPPAIGQHRGIAGPPVAAPPGPVAAPPAPVAAPPAPVAAPPGPVAAPPAPVAAPPAPNPAALKVAKKVFANARVKNYTDAEHQLFSNIRNDFGNVTGADWSGAPKTHLVNKWERVEQGENLPDYDLGQEPGRNTNTAEARYLGVDAADYAGRPAHQKMQFAALDFDPGKGSGGWGRSYFVIKKSKCEADGFIHFGDSGFAGFGGGKHPYRDFARILETSDYAVRVLTRAAPVDWIEVIFQNEVRLPADIDSFVVDPGSLESYLPFVPGKPAKGLENVKKTLKRVYGSKLRFVR